MEAEARGLGPVVPRAMEIAFFPVPAALRELGVLAWRLGAQSQVFDASLVFHSIFFPWYAQFLFSCSLFFSFCIVKIHVTFSILTTFK